MLLSDEEQEKGNAFYSPLCKSKPYLTPEQRKKLREKRNIDITSNSEKSDKPLKLRKVRRLFTQKPKSKILDKKALQKKVTKVGLPELCCTAAEWVPQSKKPCEKRKFFKTRSPEHLKKAKFILDYKKTRLEFSDGNHSKFNDNTQNISSPMSVHNSFSENKELRINVKVTENPHIIRVASIQNEFAHIIQENSSNDLVESISSCVSSDKETATDLVVKSTYVVLSDDKTSNEILKSTSDIVTADAICVSDKIRNYPIFDKENIKKIKWDATSAAEKFVSGPFRTKDKSKGGEQMIIDAGQNKIGAIMCNTCNMVYTIGHEEDEKLHSENHDMYLHLKFPGWKDERVIGNFDDGRIIKIMKDDKNFKLKKIQDILLVVNRDLGFPSSVLPKGQNLMIILFISSDKYVKGCLIAESITSASPVMLHQKGANKSYYASMESVPAICGVNRIWVARKNRKQKIASRMVDCLRSNFVLGLVVSVEELAFTDPTEEGMQFAASYTGTDSFLVYK